MLYVIEIAADLILEIRNACFLHLAIIASSRDEGQGRRNVSTKQRSH
jgi:hypothetical protein